MKLSVENINRFVSKITGVDDHDLVRFSAYLIQGDAEPDYLLSIDSEVLEDYSVLVHEEYFKILEDEMGRKPESIICFEQHNMQSDRQTWWIDLDCLQYLMKTVKTDVITYLTDGENTQVETMLKMGDFFDVGQTGIYAKVMK